MEGLSPFTRRFLALGLLLVAIVSVLNLIVLPLAMLLRQSLAQLGDARFQRTQLEAIVARPRPDKGDAVAAALFIPAVSAPTAAGQLDARIRAAAATTKIQLQSVSQASDAATSPFRISAVLAAEGDEVALMGFIARLEQGAPLLRLRRWHISRAAADGPLHLDAQMDAAWARN